MSRVTCHLSPVTCHLSPVTCQQIIFFDIFIFFIFFYVNKNGQSGGASRWRVCYQRGLLRLVLVNCYALASTTLPVVNFLMLYDIELDMLLPIIIHITVQSSTDPV